MPCPEGNFIRAVESGAAFPPHGAQVTLQCHRPGAASPCWQLPGKGGKAEEMDFFSACTGWANYTLSCVYLGKIWSTSSCLKAGRIFSVYLHRIDGFIYSPMEYFFPPVFFHITIMISKKIELHTGLTVFFISV